MERFSQLFLNATLIVVVLIGGFFLVQKFFGGNANPPPQIEQTSVAAREEGLERKFDRGLGLSITGRIKNLSSDRSRMVFLDQSTQMSGVLERTILLDQGTLVTKEPTVNAPHIKAFATDLAPGQYVSVLIDQKEYKNFASAAAREVVIYEFIETFNAQ